MKQPNKRRDNLSFARAFLEAKTRCTSHDFFNYMRGIGEGITQGSCVSALGQLVARGEAKKEIAGISRREAAIFVSTDMIGKVPKLYRGARVAEAPPQTPINILMLQDIMRNMGAKERRRVSP